MSRSHFAAVLAVILAVVAMPAAEVGVTDGPKGVVVNPRNGKAYAAFPDLGHREDRARRAAAAW